MIPVSVAYGTPEADEQTPSGASVPPSAIDVPATTDCRVEHDRETRAPPTGGTG